MDRLNSIYYVINLASTKNNKRISNNLLLKYPYKDGIKITLTYRVFNQQRQLSTNNRIRRKKIINKHTRINNENKKHPRIIQRLLSKENYKSLNNRFKV